MIRKPSAWNTGLAHFDEAFVHGRNYKGKMSPQLASKAKYLYLYQVVNDRGLDPSPTGIKPLPVFEDNPPQPIATTTVRLLVDPRYITSWGHFDRASFSAVVEDQKFVIAQAAPGVELKKSRIAFSANPSILNEVPQKRYLSKAPAVGLGQNKNRAYHT